MMLFNHTCLHSCPESTYNEVGVCRSCNSNCKTCSSYSTCTSCSSGLVLSLDGRCLDKCSPNQYVDTTSKCQICISPCVTCSKSNNCSSCIEGFILNKNLCVPASQGCDSGSYVFNGVCQPCDNNCK